MPKKDIGIYLIDNIFKINFHHQKRKKMKQKFKPNFYQPNFSYTREMAEQRLLDLGYKDFVFKGCSYTNGASFYFYHKDGREIRVSDHPLTGRRAFEVIDIPITEPKPLPTRFNGLA